jgi:hypothetical protein
VCRTTFCRYLARERGKQTSVPSAVRGGNPWPSTAPVGHAAVTAAAAADPEPAAVSLESASPAASAGAVGGGMGSSSVVDDGAASLFSPVDAIADGMATIDVSVRASHNMHDPSRWGFCRGCDAMRE